MMGNNGRRIGREYFWFALALMAILLGSAARAATSGETTAGGATSGDAAPAKPQTTTEELEQRIRVLEEKLDALQTPATAPAAPSAPATVPAPADANTTGAKAATASPTAQHSVTEQQAGAATVSGPQIFAGPGGFSFQSADGADQIRFHGEFDFDGRFYNDNLTPDGSRSTWLLRRARPIIEGTFANIFDFRFNPDFAGGKTVIQDAFVAARFNPLFVITAGKFKEPFGLERLQLSPNNRFIELGLPSDLVPNRDLGLQASGTFTYSSGTLTYQIGYFDGVVDGASTDSNATPDVDTNDKKDWVARLFARPFLTTDSVLRGLGAGVAVSYVNQVGSPTNTLLAQYKTETQRSFFSYGAAGTSGSAVGGGVAGIGTGTGTATTGAAFANGERLRISPQAYYYYKSFGLLSEYVSESQDVSRTFGSGASAVTRTARLKPASWQVAATYLLTGDAASFGTVVPKRPFALDKPGWGALELAARISELKLDSPTFADPNGPGTWFADPSAQPREAKALTLGVNWYLTQNVAWYLDYTKTSFDGGAPADRDRADESAFFTRFQVAF